MNSIFFSKSTGGAYSAEVHVNIPSDAVEVPGDVWQSLLNEAAHTPGNMIAADVSGFPVVINASSLYTLDQWRVIKHDELQNAYSLARQLPVAYLSTTFQADDASQAVLGKTLSALTPGGSTPVGFYWVDSANNHVPMTLTELQGLSSAMFDQGWAAFQNLQAKKTAVNAAATVADVQAIVW